MTPRRALVILPLVILLAGCRGSILNPLRERCVVTRVDTLYVRVTPTDSLPAYVTHEWCEWK